MASELPKATTSCFSDKVIFASLGMVVLDELRFHHGKILYNIAGGSGLYSTLGARLAAISITAPQRVGCLVLAGNDFPDSVTKTLESWSMSLLISRNQNRPSTRGLLQYWDDTFMDKSFEYTTPPLRPTPRDLTGSALLSSAAFHFLETPEDLPARITELLELREQAGIRQRPLLVWEPMPQFCTTAYQEAHLRAAKLVDVYSPNHVEFINTFPPSSTTTDKPSPPFDRSRIERQAQCVLQSGVGQDADGVVVIRCAEQGSLVASASHTTVRWYPPFHDETSPKVIDVTGAGNTFLGGFAAVYGQTRDMEQAAVAASVAASFAIEQIGLPIQTIQADEELWNGESFSSRVQKYHRMLAPS